MKYILIFSILTILCIIVLLVSRNHMESFEKPEEKQKLSYTSTNARPDDKFISIWNRELFGTPNPIKINYIIDYHYIVQYPNLEESYNILLDSEPADISKSNPDLLITVKEEKIPNVSRVYFPYFVWAFLERRMDPQILLRKENEKIPSKSKFCCFMYSNCRETMEGVKARKSFYEKIQKITNNRVDNLGRCYNNNYAFNGPWTDQIEIYRPYKFVIAFENNILKGYITEKLAFPLAARTIPIYYGCKDATKYFNKKAYIDINDFPNFESCIEYVLKVDRDDKLYNEILSQPALIDNKIDRDLFSMYYGGKFYNDLYNTINNPLRDQIRPCKFYDKNIRFITFADGKKYTSDRIMKEAYDSGFFKECKSYGPQDFNDEFISKHRDFINKNNRGYGYWIWKPYFILRNLADLKNGDYLIYLDSGTSVQSNPKRVKQYYQMLQNNDAILFRIHHDEKIWCKMDTVDYISKLLKKEDGIKDVFERDPKQRTAGIIMLKKTPTTIDIIQKWYETAIQYKYIDDSKSIYDNDPSFKEHRHDQSILSVLSKFYPSVHVTDDNYSDHPLEMTFDDGSLKPFVLTRKKLN